MRIVVTGSSGFLGGAVATALYKSGHGVTGFDKTRNALDDVTRLSSLIETIGWGYPDDTNVLLHFAAINGTHNFYERPRDVFEVGMEGTRNAVLAYRHWRECGRLNTLFVYVSSSEVYGDTPLGQKADETRPLVIPDLKNPRYSYAASKIAGEAMVRYMLADCPRAIVVRPHNVYGPGMKNRHVMDELAGQFKAKADPITVQALDPVRAYCHIEDFVSGFLAVMEHGQHGETYHIGDDTRPVSVGELVQEFTEASGHGCEVRVTSAPSGSPSYRCPDVTKLRSLGWAPRKTLSEGVREMLG